MTSKEIINRVIEFDNPPRIGLDFDEPHQKDIAWILSDRLINPRYSAFEKWGNYRELEDQVPDFKGELRLDSFGNIHGRLNEKTKGECLKGALQDGWENFDSFSWPVYDDKYRDERQKKMKENEGRFLMGAMPSGLSSCLRDTRRIDNMLMDMLLEEDRVKEFLAAAGKFVTGLVRRSGEAGLDAVIIYDDWGTQKSLLINPELWRRIFKPVYHDIIKEAHRWGMKFFLHSCGYVWDIIGDFIEIGVDVFQFDQSELMGTERLGAAFSGKAAFYCPVDIQHVMPTANRELIREEAEIMIHALGTPRGGLIAMDYPNWKDINIKNEWAQWARDAFTAGAAL